MVSTFGDQLNRPDIEVLPGVVAIPVARPQRLIDALVTLKRRFATKRKAEPDNRTSGGRPAGTHRPAQWPDKLRELFFRLAYFVDGSKKWSWRASRAAVRACRKYDVRLIIASGPPHSALLAGARAGRKLGIPYVADLRDPWSDATASVHPSRRIELRLLRVLERQVMQGAAAVTSTTAAVAALLAERYATVRGRVQVIRNGYDGKVAPQLSHTAGRLSMLFAGELYFGRDPFPLLAGIEWLLARPEVDAARVEVTFMGKVEEYSGQSLQDWMHGKRCAAIVRLLPSQSSQALAEAVARSTVLLNLAQQQPLSVPAKTYEQIACGREILLICEDGSETARVVAGVTGVTQVDPADFRALTHALLDLYTRHVVMGNLTAPAEAEVAQFSRARANELFYALLASIIPLGLPDTAHTAQN